MVVRAVAARVAAGVLPVAALLVEVDRARAVRTAAAKAVLKAVAVRVARRLRTMADNSPAAMSNVRVMAAVSAHSSVVADQTVAPARHLVVTASVRTRNRGSEASMTKGWSMTSPFLLCSR